MANIALVEDHLVLRHGLSLLLKQLGNHILFEADNGAECMQKLKCNVEPDIIIMDIHMETMDGYEATRLLNVEYPKIKVLVLSMFDEEAAVIRMLKNGARGYLLKNCSPSELSNAIHALQNNGYYHSELVSSKMIHALNNLTDHNSEITRVLSVNEKELLFLKLCTSELTYKEIAARMYLSPRTIDDYRNNLFIKLNIKSRVGLVIFAIKNGLVIL
jgi:two-component system invasion response regulator UvrY